MVQLYINGKLCDVDEEIDIQLEKDFDNTEEHVIEEAEYSFEVELPITDGNRTAFGFVDVFYVGNKFNQVYDAVLNVDESNILVGKFILEEIDNEYYSGNLYVPAKKTLKDVLGDKKMQDIAPHEYYISTWKDINKINTDVIYNRSDDKHIVYPYVLYRLPYNNTGSTLPITTQDLSASGSTFTTENIFPAYNVLSVLKDIFKGEGYNLQGNIFSIEKFNELYQSFNYSYNDYHEGKNTPYYLSFSCDYNMRTNDNTSSTLQVVNLFDDPSMKYGTDAFLLSENSKIYNEVDDYNMLAKGANTEARTLVVPKSGWYKIMCKGKMSFPVNDNWWSQDERVTVCGKYNSADRVDLSQNVFEFQIKKTDSPMSLANLYSFNMATPITPTNLSKENYHYSMLGLHGMSGKCGVNLSYEEARNKFPKNGNTALVKDYSGFDTSEFICGARLGCQYSCDQYNSDRNEDRRSNEMVFTCLPNPEKATMKKYTDDGGVEHMYMSMFSKIGIRQSNSDKYRYDYGSKTAQVLVRDDSYSNFEGYNKFTPNTDGDGGKWDTGANERRMYDGQSSSLANVGADNSSGQWTINTCVWLEEGDNISFEMMTPFNDYRDECGWAESCDWKHYYKAGVTITKVSFDFQMGYVSGDKKYIPSSNNPLPQFNDIMRPQKTNVNQWLGTNKVNDYIENFLNTFNLRLTRVNGNTYSIDTMSNESSTYGNIIDIDEWANVKDAEFRRIATKNTKLEWTIATDEEGYVHGNANRQNKTKREESGYTGSMTIENESDTSSDEDKIKSNWSYTWMKDINFVNGSVAFPSGVREVPVIGDASLWENNYISVSDKDYATDKTPRLFYLSKDPSTRMYEYIEVQRYVNDTNISEIKAPLILCKNYITYKNSLGKMVTFRLDYDNELSTEYDKAITDIFFNIKRGTQYEVDVPVILPNEIYNKIRANTLVKFNDAIFRVLGVEGHNINMREKATLKLITLK